MPCASASIPQKIKKTFWFVARIAVAIGILVFLYFRDPEGRKALADNIASLHPAWLCAAILLFIFHLVAGAYRWHLLLRIQNFNLRFRETLSLTMQALFLGLAIPGGALGGDVVKATFIAGRAPKGSKLEGMFTILIDRILGMLGLFIVAGTAGIVAAPTLMRLEGVLPVFGLNLKIYQIGYAVSGFCLLGFLGVVCLFFHRFFEKIAIIKFFWNYGDSLTKGAISRLAAALDLFAVRYKTLVVCLAISAILVHLNLVIVTFCIGKAFGDENATFNVILPAMSLANAAAVLPLTPAGVGIRDFVAVKIILEPCGVTKANSIISLLTAIILLFNISGVLFFIFRHKSKTDFTEPKDREAA